MKVRNDEDWSKQEALLRSTPEGERFLQFFVLWLDGAEAILTTQVERDLHKAVELALAAAETQMGFVSSELIGSMIVVTSMHWEHGVELATSLTHIERRVVEEALARKLAHLQEMAAAATE